MTAEATPMHRPSPLVRWFRSVVGQPRRSPADDRYEFERLERTEAESTFTEAIASQLDTYEARMKALDALADNRAGRAAVDE